MTTESDMDVAARDLVLSNVDTTIKRLEQAPTGPVCESHGKSVEAQVLILKMLKPLYKKQTEPDVVVEQNTFESKSSWTMRMRRLPQRRIRSKRSRGGADYVHA